MACTEAFALAATTTLRVTLNYTAAQNPYIDEWYLAERSSAAETLAELIIRKTVEIALDHRAQALIEACRVQEEAVRDASETTQEDYRESTRAGYRTVRGSVLP